MSKSDDFIKKYLGETPSSTQKNTAQQSNKTAGSSAADAFINKYNPTVNESYINSFLSDWNSYASKQKTAYDGLDWKSATSYKSDEDGSDLMRRSGIIKSYLQQNKDRIDEDSYKSLVSQLDDIEGYHSEFTKAFSDARDYFSQWETEDDYNKYVAYQKDRDEKSQYDLDAGQKEIEALEAELKELRKPAVPNTYANDRPYAVGQTSPASGYTTGSTMANGRPYAAGQQAQAQREEDPNDAKIRELEKQISQKKQYLNQAKHIQEGITLAGVVDNTDFKANSGYVSTYDDSTWSKLISKYGMGYEDLTYEYINNQNGIRDEIESKSTLYGYETSASESPMKKKGYDLLKENEIAIYNYYYAKEGKEKAQEYLDNIQETLNQRKATGMFEVMEGNTALELAFGVAAGLDQFKSGMENLVNFNDDYIAQTAYQMASGMAREDLADDGFNFWYNFKDKEWQGTVLGNSVGQVAYDAITTSANMAPSILASAAIGLLNPTAGAAVGNALMGASAAGNAYQQALNEGYSKDQARGYSILVGGSEMVMEKLIGGISAFGGNTLGKTLTKNVANADTALKMIAKRLGGSMISEFTEEYLQEVLDPVFSNIMLKTDEEVKIISAETIYSGILGALTAGIMEGPTAIGTEVKNYRTGKQLKAADISAARLAEIGKTFSADSVAYQLAGKVDENTGAYALGRLFNEIGATLTDQNVSEITNALVEKGMGEITAKKNAEILAYVVEGGQLTDRQAAIIEANTALAEVARTVLIDANSTVNQRTKGYNEALMALAKEKASPNAVQTKVAESGKENAPVSDKVDVQKENGSEGSSEVDTSPSQVSSITSIKNRTATIKLEDGSEVSVKDADLSPEDGVRIETIAKIDGITAADANAVLGILRASTGASAQMDSLGATEAYKYGFYGFSTEHMTKHGVFANSLTDSQRQAIYEVGQRARQQQIEKNTPKKADGTAKKTGIYFDDGNGNVVPYSESDMKVTEGKRSAGVKAAMVLRKLGIGGDIYFFESYVNGQGKRVYKDKNGVERPAPNGWYEKKDGSIHIDLNAGKNGEGYVLFTMAHELTHFIEQWSPQKYKVLADFLVENYEKGKSMDELVRAKQAKLSKSRGKKVSYAEAYSEVVADSMEAMLADGNVLDKLIELKAKDNSLFMKMKQFFDNLVAKIRNAYKGLTPDSDEGKAVLEMTDSIEKIQQLFAEALVEASENFQSAEKNTTHESGVNKETAVQRSERIVDQIRNSLQKIMALDSVYAIDASNATPYTSDWKTDEKSGHEVFKAQGGVANRPGFGRVVLSKRGAVHTIHHGNGPAKQAAFPAIKAVIEHGIEIYRDNDHDGRGYDTITFSAPVSFFGADSPLAVVVKSFNSINADKAFYIHEICDAEGNYIQLEEADFEQKNSNTNFVEPTSTVSAADGIAPKNSIRNDEGNVKNESAEAMDLEVDEKTESVSPAVLMSERTWTESDYVQEREKAAKEIAKAIGVSEKKAEAYIDSVNSIAKMIADDRTRLDYFSSPYRSSFVSNAEYGGSFDFSTLCKKRRLLTGTFTAIQKALPNTALTANEILDIRNRMKKAGLEVSCGLCYVEGSRANMGQFAKEFLKLYKQYYPDAWQPNMADVNTPDGIEWVRINHPECYEQYEYFWNHYGTLKSGDKNLFASQQKPKLYQLHTEYKGEILKVFKGDEKVEEKNLNGGIRLQSFSDFEIVHLIDTMQIIMDMARVGLAGQAYTKVPDFAWALGDTGLKINLSLIAKGVDENGKLIFDDVEGMPIDTAVALRNRYSKNVGTILVAFNDEQLLAAMADDRVDFIIPFHRSQWKKSQYAAMGLPAKTKDYTFMQNEKFIKPQYHEYRGRMVKDKATNYMPNEYWDFSKSGKENAEAYLEMCARNNKRPKFYKLLQNNGDGSYSLKADGSTDGYWKLLIDFKMYDNDGNGSPQMAVKPEFNMTEANRMLNDYKGGHSQFPVAQGVVDEFVNEYKDSHEGVQFSDRDTAPTFYSHMARVVDGVKQEKLGASSVVSMLRGKGVKAEEIKWSGIEEFLEGKKSVTKAELQEFIAGSMLQIEEETLTNKEIPYTDDQNKRIADHTAKRDEIAQNLAKVWKQVTGDEFPIRNVGAGLESAVEAKIRDVNLEKKKASFEGRLLEKLRKDLKEVIYNNDDFGFDSWKEALISIHRNRKSFIDHYEMATNDKAIIVKYCNALNAYNEVPNKISDADTAKLRSIAHEAELYNRKIGDVKSEHYAENAKRMTKWGQYKIKGGDNYREMLFKMPGSSYYNESMDMHWDDRSGILAHARIQDLNTFIGKMLFVEEIQSDWHNEGHKVGYVDENHENGVPDAPFRDNYHEYVLKRLLRMAAEQDYDSIGWTPAEIQVKRWSEKFAEGYRIEYDQDIPKFLNKYGKKWGTRVGKTTLDNGTEVWAMAITDEMKESVLKEGQAFYSDRDTDSVSNRSLLANAFESVAQNDIERNRLQEYKGKIDLIESEERKLHELREQIKDLSFAKGPKDTKKIRSLQFEANQAANRINTYDKQLLRLEASAPLQNVLNREKEQARKRAEKKGKEALEAYKLREEVKYSELLRDYRETRAALRSQKSDTATMEKEFIRIAKAYEKLEAKSTAKAGKDEKAIFDLKAALKEEIQKHREDQKTWVAEFNRLLREYEAADRSIDRLEAKIERQKQAAEKRADDRKRSAVKEKIKNFKGRLEKSLIAPTDRQYVPINLIRAMLEVCELVDTDSDTDLYKADGSINKAQEKRNLTKEKLQNLKDEYEKLKTHSDPIYAGEFDEMVYTYLTELRDKFSGKNLNEMSFDDLTEMYEILRGIEETLQDARKLIGWGDAENVYEAGDAIVAEQNEITQSRKGGKRNAAQKARDASLNLSLSPVRNVERMSGYHGSSSLLKLFKKFEQGIRKKNKFVMEAYKSFESLTSSKEYDKAMYTEVGGKKYEDVNGRKFGISKMQMMQAILSYEREAANGMHHIEGSGFSFADLDMLRNGRLRDAISEEYSHRVPAAIDMVAEFSEALKGDQWCQDYMKAARKFFNSTAKDAINETSIALKHRIIAKDKSYIPFEVDKNFVVREISAENDIQQTINSYGMLKDTKKGASQPLIITGLNNILDRHIDQVGNVYGLAIEVRNFNKVWNVRSLDAVGNDPTVKAAIQRNWGVEGVKHIEQAVQDIQGPRHSEQSAMYKKIKSGYIGATFLLNLSVVTKQIGSLYSATSMLKWRGPVRMVGNLLYTMANHKNISAEVDKYTATAWMRRQGLSDSELHTFMTDGKKSFVGRLVGKLPAVFNPGKWITAMDTAVALSLWRYAKIDTQKRTGLKGEELLKATAEFYDDVVENTQSMTDALHRPEIQKRSDIVSESLGMFKTDLYQMAGQLHATAGRFTANKTKENGMALGRTVYAVAMSAVWAQLMTTVFALLRYKVNHYRDDEDEELTAESWLKRQSFSLAGDLIGYLMPIFGSELVGVFETIMYGESENIMDNIVLDAVNDLYGSMVDIASSLKEGDMPKPEDMKKLVIKALQVLGVPANNIIRTYEAIRLHAIDIANGEFLSFEAGIDRTPKHHIHRIVEALNEGKTGIAAGLYEEALEETALDLADDGSYGKSELNKAKSSLQTALGDKYKDGEITKKQAVNVLIKAFGMDKDEAEQKVGEWTFKMEYGYAWSDRGAAYLDGAISARKLKSALMDIGGKTTDEADEYIDELDFEAKYGFAYDDRGKAYKEGDISASQLKAILVNDEGKTEEEADFQIQAYDWEKQGYAGATAAAVREYNEHCAADNVPKDIYLYIRKLSNNTKNDVDENGKVIYWTAMKRVMAEIGAQTGLTTAQKYAIARSLGWTEKNIKKYKTW